MALEQLKKISYPSVQGILVMVNPEGSRAVAIAQSCAIDLAQQRVLRRPEVRGLLSMTSLASPHWSSESRRRR